MKRPEDKLSTLKTELQSLESVVIAFSGGVDSTFLSKVAFDVLHKKALTVTATSATYPQAELEEAKKLARSIGIEHMVIVSEEVDIPGFSNNPPDRCYYCKGELFSKLKDIAVKKGYRCVIEGSNFDDLDDFRPGMKAARELGVKSPLKDAGLTKKDIRALSRKMGLPTWDKPSFACLASRFPYGNLITAEKLRTVDACERYLRELGFRQIRVRHHETIARIEVAPEELPKLLSDGMRTKALGRLRELGFTYVTLDLQGYRTGSMNEVLPEQLRGAEE
jgi:uncharacterized protein